MSTLTDCRVKGWNQEPQIILVCLRAICICMSNVAQVSFG
jgi:hypothetical protein